MGTIQEEYLIIQGFFEDDGKKIDSFIKKKIKKRYRPLFIKCLCLANCEITYFVNWDGSKEGWNTSEDAKEERKKFVEFLLSLKEECCIEIIRVIPKGELVEKDTIQRIKDEEHLETF